MAQTRPTGLIVLDGWGISPSRADDATTLAEAPVIRRLFSRYPHSRLQASGGEVGLPDGVIGNSEVGHLNLGAGRVVFQDLTRIDRAIREGSFEQNATLVPFLDATRERGTALHLSGLCSEAGVHAHLRHLRELLRIAKGRGVERIFVHAITDGRDCDPHSGADLLADLQRFLRDLGVGRIASVSGRYYIMDRDRRWDRTKRAYDALVRGDAPLVEDAAEAVRASYARGVTDEFVEPVCVRGPDGPSGAARPLATIGSADAVLLFNYRSDRVRQIGHALADRESPGLERPDPAPHPALATMTRYDSDLEARVLFPPVRLDDILGAVAHRRGLRQLRLAETEKYAHVTYFFNGGEEAPFPDEERIVVPSDRSVATYDLAPAMRAKEIADEAVLRLRKGPRPDLLVLNFANADMVGHTGDIAATCRAIETVDKQLGRVLEALQAIGGVALVTSDHGNAEQMRDPETGAPHTAHTLNPVPAILVDDRRRGESLRDGRLADVAPTLLHLLGLEQPTAMTGRVLLEA